MRDETGLPPSPSHGAVPLDVEALYQGLAGCALGQPLIYLPAVGSTNTYAREWARGEREAAGVSEAAPEGALVITDDQTAGRGRVGRVWKAMPYQQLTMSLVLRPTFPPHFLVMASALAVAEAIEAVAGPHAEIKWPNDVLLAGRKVCGILIETGEGLAILGMGVDVNGDLADDPELAPRATTIASAAGHPVSREALAAMIIRRIDARYPALQLGDLSAREALREAWRARLATLGRRVMIHQRDAALEGVAEDVDTDGTLLLRTDDGSLVSVTWGDVE